MKRCRIQTPIPAFRHTETGRQPDCQRMDFDPPQRGGGGMPRRQTGFAAIAAIFLVVVLAALGGFMLTFSNTQQLTAVQDLQGSRAFWAARAGLEWGVASVANCATFPKTSPKSLPGATATPPTFDGGFSVAVDCTPTTYTDGTSTTIYTINATAKPAGGVPGSIGYVERSMTATVELP